MTSPTPTTIYGPILSAETLRRDAIAHITAWAPSYLAEVARQYSALYGTDLFGTVTFSSYLDMLPMFKGFGTEAVNGSPLPMCVVTVTNTEGPTSKRGDGAVGGLWALAVGALVSMPHRDDATALASLYGAALRAIFVQHPRCTPHAEGTTWSSEHFENVAWDDGQVTIASLQAFLVNVPVMVDQFGGITAPPADPTQPIEGFVLDHQTIGVAKQ